MKIAKTVSNFIGTIYNKRLVPGPDRDYMMITLQSKEPVLKMIQGNVSILTPQLLAYLQEQISLCMPDCVRICDGSAMEEKLLRNLMDTDKTLIPLKKYKNCWLARTNPADVARVENRTFLCTPSKNESIPNAAPGVKGELGNWISPDDMKNAVEERFRNCMKGRIMYVIPFCMGPLDSPLCQIGVQLTDSPYVVSSMKIMTRMGAAVMEKLKDEYVTFVKALHSVGRPKGETTSEYPHWPCDPERTIILHRPAESEIVSYGSGYGGNSLLGKKCLALRIGSCIARKEGWLAEHMLILGITNPRGKKVYIAAAFPSACGKTNLAMMNPTLPGYKVECVGDDIAWMAFDERGELRAINPENGFFGVAPGTSYETNPNAMKTIEKNTIFTNVAETDDGGVFWEGLEGEISPDVKIRDWQGMPWEPGCGTPAAHPNSRFCAPARQCPIIDPEWENPRGVPIKAILFGGRRPVGVPLVYESFDWRHGVFVGAALRSETTAAAEHKTKMIMHDPFAMRPFFGYNFGHYVGHWLSMRKVPNAQLPKIFHVNWFRKSAEGKFLWPGFGENSRVLDWILRRIDGEEDIALETPIGYVPKVDSFKSDGLKGNVDYEELFSVDPTFWAQEYREVKDYFLKQVGEDMPSEIYEQVNELIQRTGQK